MEKLAIIMMMIIVCMRVVMMCVAFVLFFRQSLNLDSYRKIRTVEKRAICWFFIDRFKGENRNKERRERESDWWHHKNWKNLRCQLKFCWKSVVDKVLAEVEGKCVVCISFHFFFDFVLPVFCFSKQRWKDAVVQ